MAEEKRHHLFHHKKEDDGPVDYEKKEKHHKHMEQLGQLGAVAVGAYALVHFYSMVKLILQIDKLNLLYIKI
jgi:ABA/WDS induced protein